jgi:hypothetical protein
MIRTAQHGHEGGCLFEELCQATALNGQAPLAQHLLGSLGADDQHSADSMRSGELIDRAVTVGPIDVLQFAVADDRHELVFVPGGGVAAHHLFDLRTDDGPDLRPRFLARHSENGGMLFRP